MGLISDLLSAAPGVITAVSTAVPSFGEYAKAALEKVEPLTDNPAWFDRVTNEPGATAPPLVVASVPAAVATKVALAASEPNPSKKPIPVGLIVGGVALIGLLLAFNKK